MCRYPRGLFSICHTVYFRRTANFANTEQGYKRVYHRQDQLRGFAFSKDTGFFHTTLSLAPDQCRILIIEDKGKGIADFTCMAGIERGVRKGIRARKARNDVKPLPCSQGLFSFPTCLPDCPSPLPAEDEMSSLFENWSFSKFVKNFVFAENVLKNNKS